MLYKSGGILVPVSRSLATGTVDLPYRNALVVVSPLFFMCNSVHHDDEPKATGTGISLRKEAKKK